MQRESRADPGAWNLRVRGGVSGGRGTRVPMTRRDCGRERCLDVVFWRIGNIDHIFLYSRRLDARFGRWLENFIEYRRCTVRIGGGRMCCKNCSLSALWATAAHNLNNENVLSSDSEGSRTRTEKDLDFLREAPATAAVCVQETASGGPCPSAMHVPTAAFHPPSAAPVRWHYY